MARDNRLCTLAFALIHVEEKSTAVVVGASLGLAFAFASVTVPCLAYWAELGLAGAIA